MPVMQYSDGATGECCQSESIGVYIILQLPCVPSVVQAQHGDSIHHITIAMCS
jgi:hypothetical protein